MRERREERSADNRTNFLQLGTTEAGAEDIQFPRDVNPEPEAAIPPQQPPQPPAEQPQVAPPHVPAENELEV